MIRHNVDFSIHLQTEKICTWGEIDALSSLSLSLSLGKIETHRREGAHRDFYTLYTYLEPIRTTDRAFDT
jgi:hypothetical protein